jgi:hypothetical protein
MAGAAPLWVLEALKAPPAYKDLAALRERASRNPTLLERVVSELSELESPADRTRALWILVRCWLDASPAVQRRRAQSTAALADRSTDVAHAAASLRRALTRMESAVRLARAAGDEPLLLPTGMHSGVEVPVDLLEVLLELERRAVKSSKLPRRAKYASAASYFVALDEALATGGLPRLTNAACADVWCWLSGEALTADAVRRARSRTVRS